MGRSSLLDLDESPEGHPMFKMNCLMQEFVIADKDNYENGLSCAIRGLGCYASAILLESGRCLDDLLEWDGERLRSLQPAANSVWDHYLCSPFSDSRLLILHMDELIFVFRLAISLQLAMHKTTESCKLYQRFSKVRKVFMVVDATTSI